MPNEPLQTYRAVEPVGPHFTAAATLSSVPFVLAHNHVSLTAAAVTTGTVLAAGSSGTTETAVGWDSSGNGSMTLNVDRAIPWVARNFEGIYPVTVPNAFNRLYVYPMYTIESAVVTTAPNISFPLTTGSAPFVLPFGLLPQTRGSSTTGKLNPKIGRFPDDLIAATLPVVGGAAVGHGIDTRTNGLWIPLLPIGANFLSGGALAVNTYASSPASYARNTTGNLFGAGYQLPNDASISASAVSATTAIQVQHAVGRVIVGAGLEFNTHGAAEVVVVPQKHPAVINWNTSSNTAPFRIHWFLMGMFLG